MTVSALVVRSGVGSWTSIGLLVTHGLIPGQNIIVVDTHDGGERRKEHWDDDYKRKKRRQAQVIDAFERLVEGKVDEIEAEEIVRLIEKREEAYPVTFDFDKFLASAGLMQKLWDDYIEADDMEVLALL